MNDDVNGSNTGGSQSYDHEYEKYLRDVAMMDANLNDQNNFDFEGFGAEPSSFTDNPQIQKNQSVNSTTPVLEQTKNSALEQSPLSSFLIAQAGESHYQNQVTKSDLTKLLKEFISHEQQNGSEQNAPLTKPNGHFYLKDELNVSNALNEFGLSDEQIELNKDKFHFEPMGRISSSNGGFDAYILALNDSIEPQEAKELKQLVDLQKAVAVQNYIDAHPTQDDVVQNLVQNAKLFADKDQANKNYKRPPFVSVGDAYFLNAKGLKSHLDNIDGVKGNYRLVNILPKEEAENFSYPQVSKDLNSHYPVQLGLYKVLTKNSDVISQSDLEEKITESLKHFKSPIINNSPTQTNADILEQDNDVNNSIVNPSAIIDPTKSLKHQPNKSVDQIYEGEKVDPIVKPDPQPSKTQAKSNEPGKKQNSTKEYLNTLRTDDSRKKEKLSDDADQIHEKKYQRPKQQKSIAEIAIEAASKVTQAAIAAALALAKMLVKLVIEALKMMFSALTKAGHHYNPRIPVYDYGVAKGLNNMSNHLVGTVPTFKNSMDALKFKNGNTPNPDKANQNENDGEKLTRKEKAAMKLEQALSAGFASSPISEKSDLTSKTKDSENEFDPLAKLTAIDVTNAKDLTPEMLKSLESDVTTKLNGFDDQMKKDYINSIPLNMIHSTSPDLTDKLNEHTIYNDKHGILLGEGDKVTCLSLKGEYAVLAAYEKDSVLKYAVAKEAENGEYAVEMRDAADLQLMQHNAYNFDNKEALLNLVDEKFTKDENGMSNGFARVEILNNQAPQAHALNVAEVIGKDHPVKLKDVLESSRDAIMNSIDLNATPVVPSLHKQGIAEQLNGRQTHPTLHRLMDINDKVEAEINGSKLSGVVVGAHLNKGELNYQIKKDDQFFKIPAKDLTLTGIGNGGLSRSEIAAIHSQKFEHLDEPFKKALEANKKLDRVPLSSDLLVDRLSINPKPKEILYSGKNHDEINSLASARKNNGQAFEFHDLKPLPILVEKLNHTTYKPEYFVAIGGIGEREDGKALLIQVNKNLLGGLSVTPGATPKVEDLNANEVKRIIPFNGKAQRLSSQLLNDYSVAFKNGQDRQLQNAVDKKLETSPEIATNLKYEYYASNMAAAYLLKEQAEQSVKTPIVLGEKANLNNAIVNTVEPKQPEVAPIFMQAAPTFDSNPSATINPSNTVAPNSQPVNVTPQMVYSFVSQNNSTKPVVEPSIQPEHTAPYQFVAEAQNNFKFVQAQQTQPRTINATDIAPIAVPAAAVAYEAVQKADVFNFKSDSMNLLQEKGASLISKFEDDANSPYHSGLQLKTMLKGVYADDEFKRIQEHEKQSTQYLSVAAIRLAEIAGVSVENKANPYEILNEVMNTPDANVIIKNHLDQNPDIQAEINQNLKDSIVSADLYQTNLVNYTNDIADGIKSFTSQPINDEFVKHDYISMIKDVNNIFDLVGEETIHKSKVINDFAYASKGLINGDPADTITKELSGNVRNVDRDYVVNQFAINNAQDSIALSISQMQPITNENTLAHDNSLTKQP